MKSENITKGRLQKATAAWVHGVNSVRNPWTLPEDQFKWGVNVNCRGGVVQTRPGFAMRLSLPAGNFQGGIIFNANKQFQAAETITDTNGITKTIPAQIATPDGKGNTASEISYAIFCVDGKVYYSPFPLKQPKNWNDYQLTGIKLDPSVKNVNFVIATQSASTNSSGNTSVTPSHRLMVVQDGINPPGYWDGADKIGGVSASMPIGYWMAYSGNRLWIASQNIVYASDLANPLGWQERVSGNTRGDFSVARPITGMRDYVGQNNDTRLWVFTDQSTYSLSSGILDRTAWATTPNFQNTLFPTIGCVSGNSIAFQAGLMWWYSQGGLVSADVAAASYLSSQVLYKDIEMAKAKRLMATDMSGICSVSFENYLLCSIPYLEPSNSVTMVLDYAAGSEWNQVKSPAWSGVWTGIRPVNWSSNLVNGQPRLFGFSIDYGATNDGSFNHLWEAFVPQRYDTYFHITQDGETQDLVSRIYCQMETGLLGDSMDLKQLAYGEIDCSQIAGTIDIVVSYRGTKGAYLPILKTRLLAATEDYQYATSLEAESIASYGILQTQSRRLITESVQKTTQNTSCESQNTANVDKAFSFLLEWCGSMGIDAIRMFQDPWIENSVGKTTPPETQYCVVGENGSTELVSLAPAPNEKTATTASSWSSTQTKSITLSCPAGSGKASVTGTATASYISQISLADAVDQATSLAIQQATIAANKYRIANPC